VTPRLDDWLILSSDGPPLAALVDVPAVQLELGAAPLVKPTLREQQEAILAGLRPPWQEGT
jgi:hypothetical protein